ncbi:MAG: hypothetical protein AAGJ81_11555 [Verrucomicrobiota bacterium]
MSRALTPLALFLLLSSFPAFLSAQEAPEIKVTNVRFDRVGNDWIVPTIQIEAGKNPSPDARDRDFLDDVLFTIYVCFEVDAPEGGNQYSFYRSTVRIISLESSKRYSMKFYLPGVVRDRDDLKVDPFAWLIEMEAGGQKVAPAADQAGGNIQVSPEGFANFLSKANSEGAVNDGILLPIYLAPIFIVNESRPNLRDVPSFYRFEPDN